MLTFAHGEVIRISWMSLSVHWSMDFVFHGSPPAQAIAAATRIAVAASVVFLINLSFHWDIPTTMNCTANCVERHGVCEAADLNEKCARDGMKCCQALDPRDFARGNASVAQSQLKSG